MPHLTKNEAICLIQTANLIVVEGDDFEEISNAYGYENEGEDDSDYFIGAEGLDDIYITEDGLDMDDDGTVTVPGYSVRIHFYTKMKH